MLYLFYPGIWKTQHLVSSELRLLLLISIKSDMYMEEGNMTHLRA